MKHKVFSIASGKGGVGKTVVSSNIAYLTAEHLNRPTLLIDANITSSHLNIFFKQPYNVTLNQFLKGEHSPATIPKFSDNLWVLPSKFFLQPDDFQNIVKLNQVVEDLRPYFDFIFIDSAPGFGREALASIMSCDKLIIVTTPNTTSIFDVIRLRSILYELEFKNYELVVNMYRKKRHELSKKEIEHATGMKVAALLPYDEKVEKSVNMGVITAMEFPKSKFVLKLKSYTKSLLGFEHKKEEEKSILQIIRNFIPF